MSKNSIKKFLLEAESDSNKYFVYLNDDVISKINNVEFSKNDNYIKIDFSTIYNKNLTLLVKLTEFLNWFKNSEKGTDIFKFYLKSFFKTAKEVEKLDEIIDDTNEIMPDSDISNNATGRMVGTNQTMDLEKIFKKSMPKSVRNYSGNLGLGTVVW